MVYEQDLKKAAFQKSRAKAAFQKSRAKTQDLKNPARKTQDLKNPARKTQDLKNPARKTQDLKNPARKTQDLKNPARKTIKKSRARTIKKSHARTIKKSRTSTPSKKMKRMDVSKIEFTILMNMIKFQMLFLIQTKTPKDKIKEKIIELLKEIRNNDKLIKKNTTDKELNIIFNHIYKYSIILNRKKDSTKVTNTTTNKEATSGGYYFKNIEEKGDDPITGNDIAKLLDEMQAFFYNAQYTDEGRFVKDPNTLLSMFRGDTDAFKYYVMYTFLPQYVSMYPPFLKWDNISKAFENRKYEDLPDYLLAYQTYMRSRDEYLVEKGLKSANVLNKDLYTGFFDKLSHALDTNVTKFQQFRNKITFQQPLTFPI
jgi:hypothetical protein